MSQVLLLSDGIANQGIVDPVVLAGSCAKAKAIGVLTSTYGLGPEFQETLMTATARQGRACYGKSAEDLLSPSWKRSSSLLISALLRCFCAWSSGEIWALAMVQISPEWAASRRDTGLVFVLRPVLEWKGRDGSLCRQEHDPLELPIVPPAAFASLSESPLVQVRLRDLKVSALQDAIYRKLLDELAVDDPTLQEVVSTHAQAFASGPRWGACSFMAMPTQGVRPEELEPLILKTSFCAFPGSSSGEP